MLTFILGGGGVIKAGTDVWVQALGISGVNSCPGIRLGKRE